MNTRAATPDVADPSPPVLACLDRSLHAADVLAHALAMAGMLGAPLRVVQVIEPPTEANDRPDPLDWAIRRLEARDALNRLVAAVAGPDRATEIAVDLLQGRVAEEIRRESRRRGAGLVVIGAQGEHATGATDGMGATARQVLEHAVGMVLVVPEIARAGPPRLRRILVPLDGSSWSETALPVALRVARATGAGVTLVQVVAAPDPAGALPPEREDVDLRERLLDRDERVAKRHLEQLRRAFVDQGVSGRAQVVRGDDARAALSALLAREPVDLVVMSACGHGGARSSSARCGGVPAHLAGRAPTPLLIVRPASARVSRGHAMAAPRAAFAPPVDVGLGAGAGW